MTRPPCRYKGHCLSPCSRRLLSANLFHCLSLPFTAFHCLSPRFLPQANKVVRILRLLRLAKLLRLVRMKRLLRRLEMQYPFLRTGGRVVKILTASSLVAHAVACAWFWVGSLSSQVLGTDSAGSIVIEQPWVAAQYGSVMYPGCTVDTTGSGVLGTGEAAPLPLRFHCLSSLRSHCRFSLSLAEPMPLLAVGRQARIATRRSPF